MADYEVTTRITAEGHGAHDRAVNDSARVWEQAGRRMSTAGRQATRETDAAMRDTGRSVTTTAGLWQDAAGRWRNAAGQFAAAGQLAAAGVHQTAGAATASAGAFGRGGAAATTFAVKLVAIVSAAALVVGALGMIPAAASAVGGALSVLGGSFFGIGSALSAYKADQDAAGAAAGGSASAARASARAIRDAYRSIADAQRSAARTARNGAEAVEEAVRRVEDAKRAEARAYRDAAEAVEAANRRYRDTIDATRRAEVNLDDARKAAARTLADLQERVSDLALDQEGAAIAVAEAEKAYQRELASSESTELSRRKALYDLNVAKERASDLERESAEAHEENNDAQQRGIDGAENVLDAKERLADAQQAEIDAAQDVARAEEDAAERRRAATASVADAERDLARTRRDTAEANEDAARRVEDAMRSLADAQEDANQSMGGGGGAASKFAKEMAKLSPAGRAFVRQLIAMGPPLRELSHAAQEAFLPELTQFLKDTVTHLFPLFKTGITDVGNAMGDVMTQFSGLIKNEAFKTNLGKMFDNAVPVIGALGTGLVKLSESFVRLGANQRLTEALTRLVEAAFNTLVSILDGVNENADAFAAGIEQWATLLEWLGVVLPPVLSWIADLGPWALVAAVGIKGLWAAAKVLGGLGALLRAMGIIGIFKDWGSAADDAGKKIGGTEAEFDRAGKAADRNKGKISGFMDALTGRGGGGRGGLAKGAGLVGLGIGATMAADELLPESGSFTGPFNNSVSKTARDTIGQRSDLMSGDSAAWSDPFKVMETAQGIGNPLQGALQILTEAGLGFDQLGTKAGTAWTSIKDGVGKLPAEAPGWFGGLSSAATSGMASTQTAAGTGAAGTHGGIAGWLSKLPGDGNTWFGGLLGKGASLMDQLLGTSSTSAEGTTRGVGTGLSGLPSTGSTWFGGLVSSARTKGGELVDEASTWGGRIKSWIESTDLYQSGSALISSFWRGLTSAWDQVISWARSSMEYLRGFFPFSPAEHGAFSGSGYVDRSGAAIAQDFAASLTANTPGIIASARAATDATRAEFGLTRGPGAPVGGGTVVHITVHVAGTVVSERDLVTALQEGLARYGERNTDTAVLGRK